ncbi:MAG: hypothetical protein ACJAUP_003530 [Cellvibrionaceae bacterium]|jgi:hypothetical protein
MDAYYLERDTTNLKKSAGYLIDEMYQGRCLEEWSN